AFRFKFKGTIVNATSRSIKQKIKDFPVSISSGDMLAFTSYVKGKKATASAEIIVKVVYSSTDKEKLKLEIPAGTYEYTELTRNTMIKGMPSKLVVVLKSGESTGTFFVDHFSLIHTSTGSSSLFTSNAL